MKSDKDFIKEIYAKYEKIEGEKQEKAVRRKKHSYFYLGSMVAVCVFVLVVVFSFPKGRENGEIEVKEKEIPFAKLQDFSHFYEILNSYPDDESRVVGENKENMLDTSKTNVQVEGVDEADIVKTNGMYLATITDGKIKIIETKNPENPVLAYTISFPEDQIPHEIYLVGNQLVVIGSYNRVTDVSNISSEKNRVVYDMAYFECKTFVIIYDISDGKNPKQTRKVELDGNCISSRMIEGELYLGTRKSLYSYVSSCKNYLEEELKEDDYKPYYFDSLVGQEKAIDYAEIYQGNSVGSLDYLLLAGISLQEQKELDVTAFLSSGDVMYASSKNLYLVGNDTKGQDFNRENISYQSRILKFHMSQGKISFGAETLLDGYVSNQFALDEDECGNLRVVTTLLGTSQEELTQRVLVFNPELEEIGRISDIAKGEQLKSVRFVEERVYLVTFKMIDPFFVIDASDPYHPVIMGELKIPGYSSYLHPYDKNHVIGFGVDTEVVRNNTKRKSLKMSLYDVRNVNLPKEKFQVTIGDNTSYSELLYNHKVLFYDKEKNLIGFPFELSEKNKRYSVMRLYQIESENGFVLKGEWKKDVTSDYQKRMTRMVQIGSYYYLLSEQEIQVVQENDGSIISILSY